FALKWTYGRRHPHAQIHPDCQAATSSNGAAPPQEACGCGDVGLPRRLRLIYPALKSDGILPRRVPSPTKSPALLLLLRVAPVVTFKGPGGATLKRGGSAEGSLWVWG